MPGSQWLEICLVAMVAGVILFRLYTVLGRRTGHESTRQAPRPAALAAAAPPAEARAPGQGGSGLLDIQLADKGFDTDAFVSGAKNAYQLIVAAYQKGDRAQLKPLLSPDVYAAFDAAIAARAADDEHAALQSLRETRIVAAGLEQGDAQITLAFTADFTGPQARTVTDVWTFARRIDAADPNWLLVATTGDLPE